MSEQNLSQWFDLAKQKPWEVGVYIVYETNNAPWYSYWNGKKFGYLVRDVDKAENHSKFPTNFIFSEWRGLSTKPEVKKKNSGNRKVTRYVVTIWEEVVATYESKPNAYKHANRHPSGIVKTIRFRTPE